MRAPKPTYQKYTPPKKVYKNWKKASENMQFTPLPKELWQDDTNEQDADSAS